MAVLSILKCLNKIGQSSSYHPATICISVLCPIPFPRSVTSKDSCNIPSYFHMALHGIYSCQHHCDNVVWTDTTDVLKCYIYICTTSDTIEELLIYQDSSTTHTLCCMSAITTQPLPGGPSTRSNKNFHWSRLQTLNSSVSHEAGSPDSGF